MWIRCCISLTPEWWRPRMYRNKQQLREVPITSTDPLITGDKAVMQKGLLNKTKTLTAKFQIKS